MAAEEGGNIRIFVDGVISDESDTDSLEFNEPLTGEERREVRGHLLKPTSADLWERGSMEALASAMEEKLKQLENISDIKFAGWGWKKGKWNTKWKRRWFVLNQNDEIHYFKDGTMETSLGFIDIKIIVGISEYTASDRPRCFQVQMPNRVYHLSFESDSDLKSWVGLINVTHNLPKDLKISDEISDNHNDAEFAWEFELEDEVWLKYPEWLGFILEETYKILKKGGGQTKQPYNASDGKTYQIDLATLSQKDMETGEQIRIRRKDLKTGKTSVSVIIPPDDLSEEEEEDLAWINTDEIITTLLAWRVDEEEDIGEITEETMKSLCFHAEKTFLSEKTVLEIEPPVYIVGDIRGQFFDLVRIFENCGYPNDTKYIFLGNYTEQQRSLETFAFLLACKLKFPNQIYLLRGQQEDTAFIEDGIFQEEFGELYSENVWSRVSRVFEAMPLGATILDDLLCLPCGGFNGFKLKELQEVVRPFSIEHAGFSHNLFHSKDTDEQKIIEENDISLMVRSHRLFPKGFKVVNDNLINIFSVPNYANKKNKGCVLKINKSLRVDFEMFRANKVKKKGKN